ncbi:Major facilitator superfamily multidrug transporter mfsB [Psilocybe cubensis]|uniref:Major facilitator superfamily multidrug transporter mfsB n=1 Tax=Psilocybe cubensis TaxID=181762 RepID=A0ACB8GS39_PSICU|nr:Major facilitator superfamily multidrug transporter mfsB [Psilocybe cubensis]KAH9478348.1 Major facilitator superfamily multidrug transporter mfsB [Psilocybe cubensis]
MADREGDPSTPSTERAPIPTMMQSTGEVYMTPLPKLSMVVLSITMLGEFLSANVSTPFLLFMVRGLGEFADEAEVAFWTGILVSTFFLTQFVTSLLWATIAEKHGRRAVLMISLLGSAITCLTFGTATTLQQAICIRLLQGIFAGAVGVARGCVSFVTDPSNEGRAYAILGFCWGFGAVAGAIIGGSFERPATKWPEIFGDVHLFVKYPYLLPCGLAASVLLFGSFLSIFLGHDGGPREGAIRLLPEKNVNHPPIPEEDSTPLTPVFEDEEPRGIAGIHRKFSRRFSDYFAKRVPDAHQSSESPLDQPPLAMSSTPNTRIDRTRTFSRTSKANGSAYGYGGAYRNRLASNATLNARRGSFTSSLRRRRGSNFDSVRDSATEGADLNFAQRLLLANENAVTNIADLWVAAAMNADNEDPFEPDSDIEEGGEESNEMVEPGPRDEPLGADGAGTTTTTPKLTPPIARLSRPSHRPSSTSSPLHTSSPLRHPSSSPIPHRSSVSFSLMAPLSSRRPSNVPSIFAHPGVKKPTAVLDAQQLLTSDMDTPTDPLTPIAETRLSSQAHSQADVESLAEKAPSLMSQLPVVVIIQYGVMALHTTTHDQIFMSYLVSDYESGGLNLNAGHFAQLIALMCLAQIAYQFYLYPIFSPPRGRFSHLAMFRIGTVMFIPAYLTVVLYRPFANKNSDDSNPFLMFVTPPNAIGYANGIAQSIVSLARCIGPVIGGWLWSLSVQDGPSGYYFGFLVCAAVCALTVAQSFLIR